MGTGNMGGGHFAKYMILYCTPETINNIDVNYN